MKGLVFLLLLISTIIISNSFVINNSRIIKSRKITTIFMLDERDNKVSSGLASIISPNSQTSKVESLTSIYDVIKPSYIDGVGITSIIAGQGIILSIALIGGIIFGIDVLKGIDGFKSFYNIYNLKDALILTGSLLAGTWIFDKIPIDVLKKANRETKFALLNLFGLNSSPITVFAVITLISGVCSFGEEVFYRGFLLTFLSNLLTPPVAIAASSILYGIFHYPRGVNSLAQMGLGAVYAAATFFSGSLVVPIVAHTMFDFFTTVFPLYIARRDVKQKIDNENERWRDLKKKNMSEEDRIQMISRIIFDLLDINGDGSIDSSEIRLALQEFGFGPSFLLKKQLRNTKGTNFEFLTNLMRSTKSRPVEITEFTNILREEFKSKQGWPVQGVLSASWDSKETL